MKINEIITFLNDQEDIKSLMRIESYIPLILKKRLISDIISLCLKRDAITGFLMNDTIQQELFTVINIILWTTDIEVEELINVIENEDGSVINEINTEIALDTYDLLMKTGIYKFVEDNLVNNDITQLVNAEIVQRIECENSVGAVLSRALQVVIKMIPSEQKISEMMSSLPAMLDGLKNNPELMKTIQTVLPDMNRAQKRAKKKTGDV